MLGKKEIKFFRYPSCTFAIVSNVCIYLNIMKIININGELKKKKTLRIYKQQQFFIIYFKMKMTVKYNTLKESTNFAWKEHYKTERKSIMNPVFLAMFFFKLMFCYQGSSKSR